MLLEEQQQAKWYNLVQQSAKAKNEQHIAFCQKKMGEEKLMFW